MKPEHEALSHDDGPHHLIGEAPLGSDELLGQIYPPEEAGAKKAKPTHYKVVCISLYNEDIQHLESMVAELKRRGHTKANKSQLIRAALAQVDLGKIPKSF